jgi:hypothetical protein
MIILLALLAGGGLGRAADESGAQARDCGRYEVPGGPQTREKNRCLVQAFRQGTRATLVVARAARDGSLVTEKYFRVLGARRLELFVDVRKDHVRLGAHLWHRFVCRELLAPRGTSLAPSRCTETPLTAVGARSGRYLDCSRFLVPGGEQEGNRCLVEAFQRGERALLVWTSFTLEGDPFSVYLAVLGPGRLERLVDATRDRYGVPQWHRFLCSGLVLNPRGFFEYRDCRQVTLAARAFLPGRAGFLTAVS